MLLADVPTDGPAEVIFQALLPSPGRNTHLIVMRRRIVNFCVRIPDRRKATKLYRKLMTICAREMNCPGPAKT